MTEASVYQRNDVFKGVVIAHAAVHAGMMANFGRHFARRLVQEGAELHFFASRLPIFGAPPEVRDLESIGAEFHGLLLPQGLSPLRQVQVLVQMTLSLRSLGVDVLHTRGSVMGTIGRVAGNLAGVPLIIHHQDDLYCRESRLSPAVRWIVARFECFLSHLADRTLFVSDAVIKEAASIGFQAERCTLVGHDLNQVFQDAANSERTTKEPVLGRLREIGVPDTASVVGCVGRLAHIKGSDLFLEIAARLAPDFPGWVFVMKGEGPMCEPLRAAIAEKGLSERVFLFTGRVEAQDLPALYRCFDLFALPTRREGFGMAFAEAMSVGVPVVGPRIAPVTEVVPDGCGVLVEAENVEAFVEALRSLMKDESRRRHVGDLGKKHALGTWCGHQASDRVVDVYRELLAGYEKGGGSRK